MLYRKAKVGDAENLFFLKNDPVVRNNSISKKEIEWDEHMAWFAKALQSKDTKIWIILSGDYEFAGDFRIQNSEISIRLVEKYRGKGIGAEAVKRFSKKGHTAKIIEGNVPSMRVFVSNRFNFIDYKDGVYTLKKE